MQLLLLVLALLLGAAAAAAGSSAAGSGKLHHIGAAGKLSRQLNLTAAPAATAEATAAAAAATASQLARSAPYAIERNGQPVGPLRNIILRLSLTNQSGLAQEQAANGSPAGAEEPAFVATKNGTLAVSSSLNLNLKKLLEALEYNNYTSEVKFDHNDMVNITISNSRAGGELVQDDGIDARLLEELLASANEDWRPLNGSSNLKDAQQHQQHQRQLQRVRPMQLQTDLSTSPPIRSHSEMAQESYTVRKISEEANSFALKLLNQLNIEKLGSRNLVQAPFAVYQGLALLLTGAQGETAREMDKALLGGQSGYLENGKLAVHELDRPRLMSSLSEVIRQLHLSATHHLRLAASAGNSNGSLAQERLTPHMGGTPDQHLIVANNLLFSPSAYEIADEFSQHLQTYYNHTGLTKIEIGSTESIQVVNSWIRSATAGIIPAIINKKSTFDEFNVMALLSTSWLAQEWRDTFYRVGFPLRNSIRLKGQQQQARALGNKQPDWSLLEFVDDNRHSHFVDYIKSRPSEHIHHYQTNLNGMGVDLVSVPFRHSNHRLITLTPLSGLAAAASAAGASLGNLLQFTSAANNNNNNNININSVNSNNISQQLALDLLNQQQLAQSPPSPNATLPLDLPDSSQLTKLIATITSNPRKAMRHLWTVVAPEIITKQTLQTLQTARPKVEQQQAQQVDERLMAPMESHQAQLVQLSMPVVRSEADSSLQAALNHIGIVNAFDPNQANFIGINGHPFNYYKLHLSNVLSKTTFNLNERGINYDKTIKTLEALRIYPNREPSAAAAAAASSSAQDRDFDFGGSADNKAGQLVDEVKLDKPFMYLVCDIRTKLILYTGIVRNPEQEGP